MAQQVKVGDVARSAFSMYEADGRTKRAGAALDASTTLLYDSGLALEVVAISEPTAAEYLASFTPLSVGTYNLVIRDTVRGVDYVETFQVHEFDIDDVAADVLVSAIGIDALHVAAAWSPTLVFLRRSTMSAVDPTSVILLEVLSGDALTVIEEIDGGDLVRTGLGRYQASPAVLESAGVAFLRVTFTVDGTTYVDVLRLAIGPALGAGAAVEGSSAVMARIYTCPTHLRRARFDLTDMDDADIWRIIRDVSAHIEVVTLGNIFNAEYGVYECSGRGRRIVYHPLQHPFCRVESVTLDGDRTDHTRDGLFRRPMHACGTETIDADWWVLRAGMVEAVRRDFPMGPMNVSVTGAIGVVEPVRYASTTTLTELGPASLSVDVVDATELSPRDVIEIVGDAGSARVIATAIDRALSRVQFDPLGGDFVPIEAGAVLRTFGQVPRPIELVANYLFGVARREEEANADGQEFVAPGRIKREKTDNYEIEFMAGVGANSPTGSPKYDAMLVPYMRAIDVRFP